MTDHYPHLLINHASLWAVVFGLIFLLIGLIRKHAHWLQAGRTLLMVSAVFTIAAVQTGERAEEPVEDLPGFARTTESGRASRRLVHEHEEAGEMAQWMNLAVAFGAAGATWLTRRGHKAANALNLVTVVLGVATLVALGQAAQMGGQIRRPELREGAVTPAASSVDSSR